ncbi:MAG: sigma-70 family RNA polymerase sigma factor [Planctomycetales bacterium]|nr:sigma-70 family RNA polymerase sigma factor [Planctomycetales bacterium]
MHGGTGSSNRADAFAELLHEHHRGLFSVVYSLVQHHADAEDVYQEVVLVLWRKFDDFELGTNFPAWAAQVARFTARDFLKSSRRREYCFSDDLLESLIEAYKKRESDYFTTRARLLEGCLDKLSKRDRQLVDLCYAPGQSKAAVAEKVNRSLDAVYQAISRIRKNLARCVKRGLAAER